MSAFPDWEKYVVPQKRLDSGCIPAGYEMLLRAAKMGQIDYSTFQDDFDLDKDCTSEEPRQNNFESVANAIRERYPHVHFKRIIFPRGCGIDKLKFIDARLTAHQPILISLSLAPLGQNGWHIMPVVDATDTELILLNYVGIDGKKNLVILSKSDFVRIHDKYTGGDDVAYLDIDRIF